MAFVIKIPKLIKRKNFIKETFKDRYWSKTCYIDY